MINKLIWLREYLLNISFFFINYIFYMDKLFEILKFLGLNINTDSEPIVLLLCVILVLSLISVLSIVNIVIYLAALYITNQYWFLNKISKWNFLVNILNFYRKTRISFIILEVFLFLYSQGSVIWLCWYFIYTNTNT